MLSEMPSASSLHLGAVLTRVAVMLSTRVSVCLSSQPPIPVILIFLP
jgi:hypothetical protein